MTTASRKLTLELMNKDSQTNGKGSTNLRCHGSVQSSELESQMRTVAATRLGKSSKFCNKTLQPSKDGLDVPQVHQQGSQAQNGTHSLKESLSTSTPCSVLSITSTTLTRASDVLELLNSSLGDQNPPQELKRVASGPLPITSSSKRHCSSSHTDTMNSGSMEITSRSCSLQNQSPSIKSCSAMMQQLDTSVNLGSADRHWTAPDSAIEP